jgi:DmsE family decaheme c-type cytochrome
MHNESRRFLLSKPSQTDTCGQCHLIQKAQSLRFGHMPVRDGTIPDREGKMNCTSCHNPHGSVNEALLKYNSVNEACYTCHADKRGPFLWEHPPVLENCMNCHDPHGSSLESMLLMAPPRLCQTCHNPTDHPTDPLRPTNSLVIGSGCMQCHARIHGSNHPSGQSLTR